jgi:hypothetical protein
MGGETIKDGRIPGLEIPAVIENRYVLANSNFSGFRHRCIHHFLC